MNEPKVFQADGQVFEVIDVATVTIQDIDERLEQARASVSYLEQLRSKVESFNNPQPESPAPEAQDVPVDPAPAPEQPIATDTPDPAPAEAPPIVA